MYVYEDEDNEPMNEQAYEYLRNKSRRKGGDQDAMREQGVPPKDVVRSEGQGEQRLPNMR